tara:strand:+ start:251 stop:742 length:492 start_codon:yes stop_codon:yes gene_type:complete
MGDFAQAIFGGIEGGAQIAMGRQQRALAEHNAKIAELDAQQAMQDAETQAFNELQMGRMVAAEQRVGFAAGGVVTTTGTPAVLAAQEAAMAAQRVGNVMMQGQAEAARLRRGAEAMRFQGRSAQLASTVGGLTSVGRGIFKTSERIKARETSGSTGPVPEVGG